MANVQSDRAERTCECGMDLGPDGRCGDCDDDNAPSADNDWAGAFDGLPTFGTGRY